MYKKIYIFENHSLLIMVFKNETSECFEVLHRWLDIKNCKDPTHLEQKLYQYRGKRFRITEGTYISNTI